jgi:hypothetical protein
MHLQCLVNRGALRGDRTGLQISKADDSYEPSFRYNREMIDSALIEQSARVRDGV